MVIVAVVHEEMVNGRLENTRVAVYFSSSRAKSASSLATPPSLETPSSLRALSEDAPEKPGEELDVILASGAEADCPLRASSFGVGTMGILSRPGTFAPGITREGMYSCRGHLMFATTRPRILKASRKGMSSSSRMALVPPGWGLLSRFCR